MRPAPSQFPNNMANNETKKPATDPNVGAEERAASRRAQEADSKAKAAEVEVDKALDEAKAREANARAQAVAKEKVAAARTSLQTKIDDSRKGLEAQKAKLKAAEAAIGDATGAIITAGDVARNDPLRALAGLERAVAAFEGALK